MSPPRSFITIVSGLPRSGTSLMMQMLAAGGIAPMTDQIRTADESNPRGYFELEAVKKLRADQSLLAQAQGHSVKIIHLLLRELPNDGRYQYRVIFMKRAMDEILSSQRAMLARQGKAAANDNVLRGIYQSQLTQIEEWLGKQSDFSSLPVDHHQLLENSAAVCEEVNRFLGGDLDVTAMSAAVDPTLYRQRLG